MKQRVFKNKDGKRFAVKVEGRKAFIGTIGIHSNFAAQLLVQEEMKKIGWSQNMIFRDLFIDDYLCTGVGYTVPKGCFFPTLALKRLFA